MAEGKREKTAARWNVDEIVVRAVSGELPCVRGDTRGGQGGRGDGVRRRQPRQDRLRVQAEPCPAAGGRPVYHTDRPLPSALQRDVYVSKLNHVELQVVADLHHAANQYVFIFLYEGRSLRSVRLL